MTREARLEANLWKIDVWQALTWMLFMMPIIIPFLKSNGLSLTQIFLLQSVFSVLIVALEVPSGYFADRVGRKHSMLVGTAVATLALYLYTQAQGFWGFLVVESLLGVAAAFNSGAKQAMLYDTLVELGREEDYVARSGRMHLLGRFAEAGAALLGGVLAGVALILPFWASFLVYGAAFVLTWTLCEPARHKQVADTWSHLFDIFAQALHRHRGLKWLLAFAVFSSVATRAAVWLYQPLFELAGLTLEWFGVFWAATLVFSGVISWIVDHVDGHLGRHGGLWAILVTGVAGYLLVGLTGAVWGLGFLFLIQASRGLADPLVEDEVNAVTASDRRATVFSIKSLGHNLVYAAVLPLIGPVAEANLHLAFVILGGGLLIFGAGTLVFFLRYYRQA